MSLPSLTFYSIALCLSCYRASTRSICWRRAEAWLVTNEETWNVARAQVPAACLADRRPLFGSTARS
jgi:hypothetical protein